MQKLTTVVVWLSSMFLLLALWSWTATNAGAERLPTPLFQASTRCQPLPPASGNIVTVSTVAELTNAVDNLNPNTSILIADGTYNLTETLVIQGNLDNITLRSASGNRAAVILRGKGMSNTNYGNVPHGILIRDATSVLIADLTIEEVYFHPIQIQGEQGAGDIRLYNLHLRDGGEQLIKISTDSDGPYADNGIVECSLIEYTNFARSWYTNGVDVLGGANWIVRDNVFRNIRSVDGQLAGPAVLFWRNSLNTIVERNTFIECERAVALGLSAPDGNSRDDETVYDHQGGIIRNNFVYRAGQGDIGLTVNYARDFKIYHNTVMLNNTFPFGAIEYRFAASNGDIRYNLTDAPIWQRNGATASTIGNVTDAQPGWFANAATGDLHLLSTAMTAIDQAAPLTDVLDDNDWQARPSGSAADIGADEFVPALALTAWPNDQTLRLTWTVDPAPSGATTWRITYTPADSDQPSPITGLISSTRSYTLTGLTNDQAYTITLNAILSGSPTMTGTVTATPASHFVYLPLVVME